MPPLASMSLVTLSLTLPDKKNLHPPNSASGLDGGDCILDTPGLPGAVTVGGTATATDSDDPAFIAADDDGEDIAAATVAGDDDVDSELVNIDACVGSSSVVTDGMLLDAIMDVGVIVSEEAGVTATDGTEVVMVGASSVHRILAVLSVISPAATGDGVIVSEVGAEIVVTTGCGRGGTSTAIAVVIAADAAGGGGGRGTVPPLMR